MNLKLGERRDDRRDVRLHWTVPHACQNETSSSSLHGTGVVADRPPLQPTPFSSSPFWQVTDDRDSPVWGWVVVNYVNYGLQFFWPSGAFYREVRVSERASAMEDSDWLSSARPDNLGSCGGSEDDGPMAKQLAHLVDTIAASPGNSKTFADMLNTATKSAGPAAPSAYSDFQGALVSKPLALVYMGLSSETSQPSHNSQPMGDDKIETGSSEDSKTEETLEPDCNGNHVDNHSYHHSHVRIGGAEGRPNSLVGYFKSRPTIDLEIGDALDLTTVYTHFRPKTPSSQVVLERQIPRSETQPTVSENMNTSDNYFDNIDPDNYHRLPPQHNQPSADVKGNLVLKVPELQDLSNGQSAILGAIIDPLLAIQTYSDVLPVRKLTLPDRTWQDPMARISTFFHAGPLLMTKDIPNFNDSELLDSNEVVSQKVEKKNSEPVVDLTAGALGEWTWLQPHIPNNGVDRSSG